MKVHEVTYDQRSIEVYSPQSFLSTAPPPLPRGPNADIHVTHTRTHALRGIINITDGNTPYSSYIPVSSETKMEGILNSKMKISPLTSLRRYNFDKPRHIRLPKFVFTLYTLVIWLHIWLFGSPCLTAIYNFQSVCEEGVGRARILSVSSLFSAGWLFSQHLSASTTL